MLKTAAAMLAGAIITIGIQATAQTLKHSAPSPDRCNETIAILNVDEHLLRVESELNHDDLAIEIALSDLKDKLSGNALLR